MALSREEVDSLLSTWGILDGNGEQTAPLRREHLESLFEANGGAECLDLSGKNLSSIDLRPNIFVATVEHFTLEDPNYRALSRDSEEYADLLDRLIENGFSGTLVERDFRDRIRVERFKLRGVNLQRAIFGDVTGGSARLQGVDFSRANLRGVRFYGTDLSGADFTGAIISERMLRPAYDQRWFRGTILRRARFEGAVLRGVEFSDADIQDASFYAAHLEYAHFQRSDLPRVSFFGARLQNAHFTMVDCTDVNFRNADLQDAFFSNVRLSGADFRFAGLRRVGFIFPVDFDNSQKWEEAEWDGCVLRNEKEGDFLGAETLCRLLKIQHQNAGLYERVGDFHYREWVCRRKALWQAFTNTFRVPWGLQSPFYGYRAIYGRHLRQPPRVLETEKPHSRWRVILWLLVPAFWWKGVIQAARWLSRTSVGRLLAGVLLYIFGEELFGYGEKPWRVVRAGFAIIVAFALAYFPYSSLDLSWPGLAVFGERLWKALYFSGTSFTALGYGEWLVEENIRPEGWTRNLGVVQSLIGVFLLALFLVTFTRRWTR